MTDQWETSDWEDCWAGEVTGYDEWSYRMGSELATTLEQFFEAVGVPDTVGSVGCGPATTLLGLAGTYPQTRFFGYDIASTAIERARDRRDDREIGNAQFAVDSLPRLDIERTFDFVYSLSTLHYVTDTETAVESLWARVTPGGYLAVNYPTPFHEEEWAQTIIDNWEEVGFESRSKEWVRDRLHLVSNGENTLTEARIGALLGRKPRDIRAFGVEMPDDLGEQFRVTVLRKPVSDTPRHS